MHKGSAQEIVVQDGKVLLVRHWRKVVLTTGLCRAEELKGMKAFSSGRTRGLGGNKSKGQRREDSLRGRLHRQRNLCVQMLGGLPTRGSRIS